MVYTIENAIEELVKASSNQRINVDLPTDRVIDNYETLVNIKFQDDYRYYLKHANNIFHNLDEIVLLTNRDINFSSELKNVIQEARELGIKKDWIPICEDNGNYFCLTPEGKIIYYDLNGVLDEEWDNLAIWIREVWIKGN